MHTKLPSRPNLDHLRGQAKELLAALRAGREQAVREFELHLPAAAGLTREQIRAAGYKLTDAQSVVARRNAHASWPKLVHYVEQLRALEGTWSFTRLELDGAALPDFAFSRSRLVIDGDRFRSITPEAVYDGVFDIDVESEPHRIDIDFEAGPEAGRSSRGLFRFEGEQLVICLGLAGVARPSAFATRPGSGHALETLVRSSRAHDVRAEPAPPAAGPEADAAERTPLTPFAQSLQGSWAAVQIVKNGQKLPASFLSSARREMKGWRTTVRFGPQLFLDARTRVDEGCDPIAIDYEPLDSSGAGGQLGIARWVGEQIEFCMATSGAARPDAFRSEPGSGWTLSRWRRVEA